MKQHFTLFKGSCVVLVFFTTAALSGQSSNLANLFPDIAGWQKKGAAETYAPENLYLYIDGAAENFLTYDFKQLAVQNYTNAQGQALSAEIYFHGTAENAFGIYSSEKPVAGKYFELGSQGYAESGILNFICSAYYVKLSGFELGQDGQDVLMNLGRAIAGAIGNKTTLPKILQAFPEAGKIPNSERFILNNFLGHYFLHKAYVADYRVKEQNFQLFIISAGSEEEARAMIEIYAALDKKRSVPIIKPHQGTDVAVQPGTLTINDPYNGTIRLLWQGKFICGSSGQNDSSAEYLVALGNLLPK